ncbi:Unknown protein sequence [Pseudomonas coronafaciens pv. oryzae]|nr:Unknown protein sequence [Pseudomonas coronafaciens pv. oryzae]
MREQRQPANYGSARSSERPEAHISSTSGGSTINLFWLLLAKPIAPWQSLPCQRC